MFLKKQRTLIIIALFFVIFLAVFFWYTNKQIAGVAINSQNFTSTTLETTVATTTISLLTGANVPIEQASSSWAAVMVDNYTAENSQYGIADAPLVFEAPVEGGITRYLAIVPVATSTAQIGPVRSTRPYFIDWASEFGGLYVHVGGSVAALEKIKNTNNLVDVDEMKSGDNFWRDPNRNAPHSTFTSGELLKKVTDAKVSGATSIVQPWLFLNTDEEKKIFKGNAGSTTMRVGTVDIEWRYDRKNNLYERYVGGVKQTDAKGQVITAKNIVIVYTDIRSIDADDRKEVRTLGGGRALILLNGKELAGSWTKLSSTSRLRFFGPDTKEIQFNPGNTWVEVTTK